VNQLITEKYAELKNLMCCLYVGDEGLALWNSTSALPSLAPFGQDLLAAPASQGYVNYCFVDRVA